MVRRYGLRDDQWERIKGLPPGREDTVGVSAKDNRLFVEAVLYRYRAGIAWRDRRIVLVHGRRSIQDSHAGWPVASGRVF